MGPLLWFALALELQKGQIAELSMASYFQIKAANSEVLREHGLCKGKMSLKRNLES